MHFLIEIGGNRFQWKRIGRSNIIVVRLSCPQAQGMGQHNIRITFGAVQ